MAVGNVRMQRGSDPVNTKEAQDELSILSALKFGTCERYRPLFDFVGTLPRELRSNQYRISSALDRLVESGALQAQERHQIVGYRIAPGLLNWRDDAE